MTHRPGVNYINSGTTPPILTFKQRILARRAAKAHCARGHPTKSRSGPAISEVDANRTQAGRQQLAPELRRLFQIVS
jgi:hypothetical protein